MNDIVTQYNMTGNCQVDVSLIEKLWDHRFVLYDYEEQFQFVKFLRRGSSCRDIKCNISTEQAQEIIQRLALIRSTSFSGAHGSWRKEGMSEFDMRRKHKK